MGKYSSKPTNNVSLSPNLTKYDKCYKVITEKNKQEKSKKSNRKNSKEKAVNVAYRDGIDPSKSERKKSSSKTISSKWTIFKRHKSKNSVSPDKSNSKKHGKIEHLNNCQETNENYNNNNNNMNNNDVYDPKDSENKIKNCNETQTNSSVTVDSENNKETLDNNAKNSENVNDGCEKDEEKYSDIEPKKSQSDFVPSTTVKPMGFKNPKGYYYLNCVVQVIASCDDFKKDIETWDCKKYYDKNDDSIFVEGLFDLIQALRKSDENSLNKSLDTVQQYISESSFGDDVYKCFMNILSRVSKVIKTNIDRPKNENFSLPVNFTDKAKQNFEKFKNRNPGFVFDNFYGQLTFQMTCDVCMNICNESFQVIKSMALAVPNSTSKMTLENCVKLFFNVSPVELEEPLKCECPEGSTSVESRIKLTHSPKYLFIYLNRGSYTNNGAKIDTFVTCDSKTINIEVSNNDIVTYKLISVIDHVGNTFYGHYYCKSNFEGGQWWLLNDAQVQECSNDVVTKDTIVFLFKRN